MRLVRSLVIGFIAAMAIACLAMIPLYFSDLYFSGSGASGQLALLYMVCGLMLLVFGAVFGLSWWLQGSEPEAGSPKREEKSKDN